MPVYNAGEYLGEAIESILDQSFTNYEFIIVDDCSTDNSKEIAEEYSKKDKRIIVLGNEKNLGIAETRTKGTKYAKGKYIAVSDADDISIRTRFKEQHDYLERHRDCGVVGGFIELFDSDTGKVTGVRKYFEDDERLRKRLFLYCPVAQPVSMIRRDVFYNVGYYDPRYPPAEDLDMWFRIGTRYRFANIQKVLLRYRVHKNSATISKIRKMEANTLEIRKKYSRGYGYSMTLFDKLYNLVIRITSFVPYNIKIMVFNFIRDE
ncbi:Glycosyltransferase AglE [uncultured archaeon]|nr:Glycosyltransferase AglE [uncultured archaeon]